MVLLDSLLGHEILGMPLKEKEYWKLPGVARDAFTLVNRGRNYLFLGKDHLLMIANSWFSETYKRFYYRDIQAIVLTKTMTGKIYNSVYGGTAAFFGILMAIGVGFWGWREVGIVVTAIFMGIFVMILLINTLLGATCVTTLQTAVHTERLPSLGRLRSARKALHLIQAKVEEVQGAMDASIIDAHHDLVFSTISVTAHPKGWRSNDSRRHENGRSHEILSFLFLADAVISAIHVIFPHISLTVLEVALAASLIGVMIWTIAHQVHTDLPKGVQCVVWVALAYIYISLMWIVAAKPIDPKYWSFAYHIFSAIGSSVLGCVGLALVYSWRRQYARRTHTPFPE